MIADVYPAFVICICTYKRPHLLSILIDDILKQTILPGLFVIVDGFPNEEVLSILKNKEFPLGVQILYLLSNHSNLSYQRYLGWLVAQKTESSFLLYLDDDLRISQQNAIEKLVGYLQADSQIVGVTSVINMGEMNDKFVSQPALVEHNKAGNHQPIFVNLLGSARKISPGGLTPAGHRVLPIWNEKYSTVQWLRGGVMLFRMSAITSNSFSVDLFALDHIRCGKGEDTFLSRQVMQHGKLIYAHDIVVEHPNSDLPKTYPISAYKLAFATAYSRRFLNDHYRITRPPFFMDRFALLNTYIGNNLINLGWALVKPHSYRFAYAFGYFMGSLNGLIKKPTAKKLTPGINWLLDAENAISHQVVIQ